MLVHCAYYRNAESEASFSDDVFVAFCDGICYESAVLRDGFEEKERSCSDFRCYVSYCSVNGREEY